MKWLNQKLSAIRELEGGPRKICSGIAIGTLIGFLPLIGIKTLLAMGIARISRTNILAAAIGVTLHDIFLPIAPVILLWEYQIGCWLLNSEDRAFDGDLLEKGLQSWLNWSTLEHFEIPLLVGGVAIGLPMAILAYALCYHFLWKEV